MPPLVKPRIDNTPGLLARFAEVTPGAALLLSDIVRRRRPARSDEANKPDAATQAFEAVRG